MLSFSSAASLHLSAWTAVISALGGILSIYEVWMWIRKCRRSLHRRSEAVQFSIQKTQVPAFHQSTSIEKKEFSL